MKANREQIWGRKPVTLLIASVVLLSGAARIGGAQTRAKSQLAAAKQESVQPFTFKELLKAAGVVYERRLKELINRRGIGFTPTPAEIQELRQAGASPVVISLIVSKAPQPKKEPPPPAAPTPPPPPQKSGPLTVECVPTDCEVSVNGALAGQTSGGSLVIQGLSTGSATIDIKQEGYLSDQAAMTLKTGAASNRRFVLKPTLATQQMLGKQVYASLVQKLGGEGALRDAGSFTAAGSAAIWQAGGQRTDWTTTAKLKSGASLAYLEIAGAGRRWWVSMKGGDSKSGGSGELKGGPVAIELEKAVRMFREFQFVALLTRAKTENMSLLANSLTPVEGDSVELSIKSTSESYTVSIGADGLPSRVVFASATGLGSGLEAVYSKYAKLDKIQLPKHLEIRYVDQKQHGFEFEFDDIKLNPRLADKDFRR